MRENRIMNKNLAYACHTCPHHIIAVYAIKIVIQKNVALVVVYDSRGKVDFSFEISPR